MLDAPNYVRVNNSQAWWPVDGGAYVPASR